MKKLVLAAVMTAFALSGCSTMGMDNERTMLSMGNL